MSTSATGPSRLVEAREFALADLALNMDRESKVPLYEQLEGALEAALETGELKVGERVPAIQELAVALQVSRNTVRRAYQELAARGLLAGTAQSGFRAARPAQPVETAIAPGFDRAAVADAMDAAMVCPDPRIEPFRAGLPDVSEFPLELWEKLRAQVLRKDAAALLNPCDAFGHGPLREALAEHLRESRGITCEVDQIVISAGAQQALHLVAQTLLSPGDAVGMEEPGSPLAKAILMQAGARVMPLLVDEEGLSVPSRRRQVPLALVYCTPASQFPLAAPLSVSRRAELLEFASESGAWVIEDDSDGEFAWTNSAPPSLQAADSRGRVIYLGTTGRTLFPSLEIAYLVVPAALAERFRKTKMLCGAQPPLLDQATLAQFLSEGHFKVHVERMKALYYRRFEALAESVDSEMGEFLDLEAPAAGLHAVAWLKRGADEGAMAESALRAGVELPAVSAFGRTALVRPGVVFGFAAFPEKEIRGAVRRLGHSVRKVISARPGGFWSRFARRPAVETPDDTVEA